MECMKLVIKWLDYSFNKQIVYIWCRYSVGIFSEDTNIYIDSYRKLPKNGTMVKSLRKYLTGAQLKVRS